MLRVEKDGFKVQLLPKRDMAFLPFTHSSDFHEVRELTKLAIKPGQKLDKVMYFSRKQKTVSFLDQISSNEVMSFVIGVNNIAKMFVDYHST